LFTLKSVIRSPFRWNIISETWIYYMSKVICVENLHLCLHSFKKDRWLLCQSAWVKEENQVLRSHRCAKYFKAPDHDASHRWWKLMSQHSNATMARRDRSSRNEMWENRSIKGTDDKSIQSSPALWPKV